MPSGAAFKPGDIIRQFNGKTIEITNTDAEGRLILADALTWAVREMGAERLVDLATLTGAVVVALGSTYAGLISNDDELAADVEAAGGRAPARSLWRLPLHEEYRRLIDSNVADLMNTAPKRKAGTIYAGSYLQEFVEDKPWAHLDIAGTSWDTGPRVLGLGTDRLRRQAAGRAGPQAQRLRAGALESQQREQPAGKRPVAPEADAPPGDVADGGAAAAIGRFGDASPQRRHRQIDHVGQASLDDHVGRAQIAVGDDDAAAAEADTHRRVWLAEADHHLAAGARRRLRPLRRAALEQGEDRGGDAVAVGTAELDGNGHGPIVGSRPPALA